MIIYATKQTFQRYNLKLPAELTPPVNMIAQAVIEKKAEIGCWNGGKIILF